MARKRTKSIPIEKLKCYRILLEELQNNPELEGYDLSKLTLVVKSKKPPIVIYNIDVIINNLKFYIIKNKTLLISLNGVQFIEKSRLASMLRISRPTLDS